MILPHFLFIAALIASKITNALSSNVVIYVDPDNGTLDPNCWTGGINLPCKNYDLAKEGALLLKVKVEPVDVVPSQKMKQYNKSCQQTWTYLSNSTCVCGTIHHRTIICSNDKVSILDCMCMTSDDEKDPPVAYVGACPYGCGLSKYMPHWWQQLYHPLPMNISKLNDAMCGRLNRESRLCSKCKKGYSPLAYSYDYECVRCTNGKFNWLKFVAVAFIPLTIFYFMVIIFRVNATNPYLYGYITLNQALGSPINLRSVFISTEGNYKLLARLVAIPYTIWNLEQFRSLPLNICLDLTTLQTLALDYAIAVYPLALVVITYILIELHARGCRLVLWLWSPFHRCCVRFTRIMDIKSSLIKAFATFLLLSYVKLINSTCDMLLPVKAYNVHGDVAGIYVYYDASYKYFGKEHLPYAIMAIAFFVIFILSPIILLLVYPLTFFQRCLNSCRLRNHGLQVFVDTFQGHYKDGTEPGTRDCRWFAAVYFLARIIILYVTFAISEGILCYTLSALSLIFLGMLMIVLKPYKSSKVNTLHTLLVFYIALACFSVTFLDQAELKAQTFIPIAMTFVESFSLLPTVLAVAYVLYYIALRFFRKCKKINK